MKKLITFLLVSLSVNAQAWELIEHGRLSKTYGNTATIKQVSDEGNSILSMSCTAVSNNGGAFHYGMTIRPYNYSKQLEYGQEQKLNHLQSQAFNIMKDGTTLVWNGGEQHYSGSGFKDIWSKAHKHCGKPY